jgi:probable phosphoglycerate mutase
MTNLTNRYFLMRHGESEANLEGIISSDPSVAIANHGLTSLGQKQAEDSSRSLLGTKGKFIILHSDFKRSHETAIILGRVIGSGHLVSSENLRERSFGDFEGTSNTNYNRVWEEDEKNPCHTVNNVESAVAVLYRVHELINHIESVYADHNIVLVSHGDVLQILQTSYYKRSPSYHRQINPIETAEIRFLNEESKSKLTRT